MRSAALEPYHPTGERSHSPLAGGSSTRASTPTRTPAPSSRPSTSRPPTFRVRRPQHITRAQPASVHSAARVRRSWPSISRVRRQQRGAGPRHPIRELTPRMRPQSRSSNTWRRASRTHARATRRSRHKLTRAPRGLRSARTGDADQPPALCTYRRRRAACSQGPTHWPRVPASGVPCVPSPVYRVARLTLTSGDDAGEQDRQARVGVRRGLLQHGHGRHHLRHRGHDEGGPHPNPNPNPNPNP